MGQEDISFGPGGLDACFELGFFALLIIDPIPELP